MKRFLLAAATLAVLMTHASASDFTAADLAQLPQDKVAAIKQECKKNWPDEVNLTMRKLGCEDVKLEILQRLQRAAEQEKEAPAARAAWQAEGPYPGESDLCREARQKGNLDYRLSCKSEKAYEAQHQLEKAAEEEKQRQWRRQYAERQKQQEAAAAAQAIIDAKPVNRLFRGYQYFGHVRFCHESRDGYLVQYVNDAEMEKAQRTIKDLVAQTTKEDPSIDTDDLWRKALNALKGAPSEQVQCQNSLIRLFKLAPTPVYSTEKP
jgi:hypothetical protein